MIEISWDERVRLTLMDSHVVSALNSLFKRGKISPELMELIDNEALDIASSCLVLKDANDD